MSTATPGTGSRHHHHHKKEHTLADIDHLRETYGKDPAPVLPPGPFSDTYRIASYTNGLVGAAEPQCDVMAAHWDQEGLFWPDENNPKPDDLLWDAGVHGGITWDGTFYRDTARYPAGGQLFWSSYFKPGSEAGIKKGYWINFGLGWSHLHNDNPAEILTGASQKLFYDAAASRWTLVIQATKFVTYEVIEVWTGTKQGGNDPTGTYTRDSGLDPIATLTVESA